MTAICLCTVFVSKAFTAANIDGNDSGLSATAIVLGVVVLCMLICVAVSAVFVMWRWRARRLNGKAYFKETEDERHTVRDIEETEDMAMTLEVDVEIKEESTTVTRD